MLNVLPACAISIVVISLKGLKSRSAFVRFLSQQLVNSFDLWGFANGAQYLLPSPEGIFSDQMPFPSMQNKDYQPGEG